MGMGDGWMDCDERERGVFGLVACGRLCVVFALMAGGLVDLVDGSIWALRNSLTVCC